MNPYCLSQPSPVDQRKKSMMKSSYYADIFRYNRVGAVTVVTTRGTWLLYEAGCWWLLD